MKHFYFYDCPRTGGTSFKRWSKRTPGITRVYYGDNKTGWHHVPYTPIQEVRKLAPSNADFFTFTLLRDPVEHVASLYSKIRIHKHAWRPKLEKLSFHEWIYGDFKKDREEAPAPWGFSMVRFYDSETENRDRAIANIETMDFVGFTDRLNQDLDLLMDLAGSQVRFDRSRHNQVKRKFNISEKDRQHLLEIRADDLKLVNYFRNKRGLRPYA
jgi:hypothetical protein